MWLQLDETHLANFEDGTFIACPDASPGTPQDAPHPLFFIDVSKSQGLQVTPIFIGTRSACRDRFVDHARRLGARSDFSEAIAAPDGRLPSPEAFADLSYTGPCWISGHHFLLNPRRGHRITSVPTANPAHRVLRFLGPHAHHTLYAGPTSLVEVRLSALAHYLHAGPLLPPSEHTVTFHKKGSTPAPASGSLN